MPGRKVLSAKDAKKMNRLYSVESDLSITGGVADHRLSISSSIEIPSFRIYSFYTSFSCQDQKRQTHRAFISFVQIGFIRHADYTGECLRQRLAFKNPKSLLCLPVVISRICSFAHLQNQSSLRKRIFISEIHYNRKLSKETLIHFKIPSKRKKLKL